MVKIATPVSHLFKNLSTAKEIIAVSNCLEVRESSLKSDWPKEYLFHVDIDINHEWNEEKRKFLNIAFDKKPNLQLISFQATTWCSSPKLVDNIFEIGGKVFSRDEMMNSSIKIFTGYVKPYIKKFEDYPNVMKIGRQTTSLPLSSKISDNDVERVVQTLMNILV